MGEHVAHFGAVKRRRRLKKVFEVELLHGIFKRLDRTAELSPGARLRVGRLESG